MLDVGAIFPLIGAPFIRPSNKVVVALSTIILLSGSSASPTVATGPEYHTVMTRPLKVTGWRTNDLYHKDELMTDVFNALAKDGQDPMWFQVFEAGRIHDVPELRALVVCKVR